MTGIRLNQAKNGGYTKNRFKWWIVYLAHAFCMDLKPTADGYICNMGHQTIPTKANMSQALILMRYGRTIRPETSETKNLFFTIPTWQETIMSCCIPMSEENCKPPTGSVI